MLKPVDPPLVSLNAPLPPEFTGRTHGLLGRYKRFPVFSRPWVLGRWAVTLPLLLLALVPLIYSVFTAPELERPYGALLQLTLQFTTPLVLGPWLAWQVRRQAWPAAREWWSLVAVMVGMVIAITVFTEVLAEPMKQAIAERTGMIGPDGQRRKVAIMVGVNIMTGDQNSPPTSSKSSPSSTADRFLGPSLLTAMNHLSAVLITFVLAGGLGLRGWQREREGLAALQRERELAQAQAQRREAEMRLSVLAAQVEPHFLFNTLAGVRSAIATDPPRASEMIDRLVEYLRAAIPRLRSDGAAQATVAAQFDIVRAYLGLMATRMPRLHFSVQLPPDLASARCPPLMLISLAENAVKHGVEPKIGPAQIQVIAERSEDGRLRLRVEDDGVGFGVSQSGSGLGLTNLRERLQALYGDRAALTLKARTPAGVAAILTLPLEQAA